MPNESGGWSPASWKTRPINQEIQYDDPQHLERVVQKLGELPPIVCPAEASIFYIVLVRAYYLLTREFLYRY